jgi:hypothetical protein
MACCGNPRHVRALIPCRPFEAWYCESCKATGEDWGKAKRALWWVLIWPWWKGEVAVQPEERP